MNKIESSYEMVIPEGTSIERKIAGYVALKKGWLHGEGVGPSSETIKLAIQLAKQVIKDMLDVDSAPGGDGSIRIIVYGKAEPRTKYLQIAVAPRAKFWCRRYERVTISDKWKIIDFQPNLNREKIAAIIDSFKREIYGECRNTSASWQSDTTSKTWEPSTALLSRTSGEEYLSYLNLVPRLKVHQFATT